MLKILVSDGEMDAHITTLEASKILVGYDVSEYGTNMLQVIKYLYKLQLYF